jgi:hypothetical protein
MKTKFSFKKLSFHENGKEKSRCIKRKITINISMIFTSVVKPYKTWELYIQEIFKLNIKIRVFWLQKILYYTQIFWVNI